MSRLLDLFFFESERKLRDYAALHNDYYHPISYNELLNISNEIIANNPPDPDLFIYYLLRGESKRRLGDLEGAINNLTIAMEENDHLRNGTGNFYIFLMRALAKYDYNDVEGARMDIITSSTLGYENEHFYAEDSFADSNDLNDLDKIVHIYPDWYLTYLARAGTRYDFEGTEHPDLLFSDLRVSLELIRNVNSYLSESEKEKAEKFIEHLIGIIFIREHNLFDDKIYSDQERLRHINLLEDGLTGIINIRKDWMDYIWERGWCRIELSDYQGAIEDYDSVIESDPHDCVAFNNRGEAKFRLGMFEEAMRDYNRAVTLCPDENFEPYGGLTKATEPPQTDQRHHVRRR